MPPKKAAPGSPATLTPENSAYLATCFQNCKVPLTKENFDFDAIAKQTGLKDERAAYMKFWRIKEKWGIPGVKKNNDAEPVVMEGAKAGATGKKRTAAGQAKGKKTEEAATNGEDGGSEEGSTGANAGSESEAEAENGEEESPSKKPKTE